MVKACFRKRCKNIRLLSINILSFLKTLSLGKSSIFRSWMIYFLWLIIFPGLVENCSSMKCYNWYFYLIIITYYIYFVYLKINIIREKITVYTFFFNICLSKFTSVLSKKQKQINVSPKQSWEETTHWFYISRSREILFRRLECKRSQECKRMRGFR